MKLAITNDHAAVDMKNALKQAFPEIEWIDVGAMDPNVSVDYPDFGYTLGQMIEKGEIERGVALCGSGIGISIALNRNPIVRAALVITAEAATLSRQHNDANVIVFGARLIDTQTAIDCLKAFLSTDFEGGRHQKRVDKLGCGH